MKKGLTENLISFLAGFEDILNYPKSFDQLVNWDKNQYYRGREKLKEAERKERVKIKKALLRLKKAQTISFNKKTKKYALTPKGWLKYLFYYNQKQYKKAKVKGNFKFLMVFDIPEEHRRFRNLFRQCLKNLNCEMIQRSVWLTNNEKDLKFIQKIAINCELGEYVKFVEIKRII